MEIRDLLRGFNLAGAACSLSGSNLAASRFGAIRILAPLRGLA